MLPIDMRHNLIGVEERFDCFHCGDTRGRLYVKATPRGWYYYCHNCGYSGFQSKSTISTIKETMMYLEELKKTQSKSEERVVYLPSDFSTEIPTQGLVWLYKYGITDEEIKRFGFGYSERLNRLIMPVFNNGVLVYWQGRNLGKVTKKNPKYINMRGNKDALFTVSNDNFCISDSPIFVYVEDILSAIKVGRRVNTASLLGSYVISSTCRLKHNYKIIYLWLDYDKRVESVKYCSKVQLITGIPCKSIITEKDPKEYSDEEIKEILSCN